MKYKFAVCVVFVAAVAALAPRAPAQQRAATDARVAAEISARMRPLGLAAVGEPQRQGNITIVNALDSRGAEMRVVMDAQHGSVLSVSPLAANYYVPSYDAGPRIITLNPDDSDFDEPAPRRAAPSYRAEPPRHEQRHEPRQSRRSEPHRNEQRRAVREVMPMPPQVSVATVPAIDPDATEAEDAVHEERRRALEQERRMTAPPPRVRPRTVLAPPPYADTELTPLRPLYHRDSGKFGAPAERSGDVDPDRRPAEDPRTEARASVPQILPQIPAPPRAVGLPVPVPQQPQPDVEQKPAETSPEDMPPPGTPTGDFNAPQPQ